MSAIFRDARLKVDRANKHVEELKAAIFSLKESNTARIEKNLETGHQELIHTLPGLEDALLNLSLIVGDAIHNLHTALDFAWVSTIERHIPAASSKFTKFPVRETREKLEAALHGAKIDTACPSLFNKIVSDIQPYRAGQAGVIYALHELDIFDKHLLLLESTPNVGIKGIVIRDKDGQILHGSGMPVTNSGPYVIAFESGIHIEDKGQTSFAITIKEAGIFKGLEVLDMLSGFSQYISYVVQLLENL